jgi:hypothetical protein
VVLFVTREHIHVDRIATAWAIRRFVDPDARFNFVSRSSEPPTDGVIFDMRGAELGHRGGRCTLDALIDKYALADEGLRRMAAIIRAADLPQQEPSPALAAGVLAIFDGIRDGCDTDQDRLERGSVVCDALYAYCAKHADAEGAL